MFLKADIIKFKKLLDIEEENIKLIQSTENSCDWDNSNNKWLIEYNPNKSVYYLIHEFGHIYLCKKTQYNCLCKTPSEFSDIDLAIWELNNAIVDSFVDYNLSNFNSFSKHYCDYIRNIIEKSVIRNSFSFITLYIFLYLSFNYILDVQAQIKLKEQYDILIDKILNGVIGLGELKTDDFDLIQKQLDKFSNIRDSHNKKTLLDFSFNTINIFKYENEEIVLHSFKEMYPDLW